MTHAITKVIWRGRIDVLPEAPFAPLGLPVVKSVAFCRLREWGYSTSEMA